MTTFKNCGDPDMLMVVSQDLLLYLRQKKIPEETGDFIVEFLKVWDYIHQKAPSLTLTDVKSFTAGILKSITLPFYQKFKDSEFVEKREGWVKELSSIVLNWAGRGLIMFPLRLVTYEVVSHSDKAYEFYLKKLRSGEMRGTIGELFNFLFPMLINVAIPLSDIDLMILKSYQLLQDQNSEYLKGVKHEDFATHLDVSTRTILRRIHNLHYYQIPIAVHFLDMGKLGYETFLLSHYNPIPEQLAKFTLYSVDLMIGTFSLFQIPISKSDVFVQVQDELEPMIFQQLSQRFHSWNLSGLSANKSGWKNPPSFLHNDPSIKVVSPSAAFDISLKAEYDLLRLTPADVKILDFITTQGEFHTLKNLSNAVKVSLPQVSKRMNEYRQNKLVFKTIQFFNIGLDLNPSFCISCPNEYDISWIGHLLAFPKADVFYHKGDESSLFFGHVKLPNKWIKGFTRRIYQIKKQYPDIKFYYTIEPPNIPKWNISLSETYL